MAKRSGRKHRPRGGGTDAALARRLERTRRKAEAIHSQADAAHRQSEEAHVQAHDAHMQARKLKEEIRAAGNSAAGKPMPPRVGGKPPRKGGERGSPVMAASLGEPADSKLPFTIVGVGASAGGYEAFVAFLQHLPKETGMSFVLVQHLDPGHPSHLAELLSRSTSIPVVEVRNGMVPRPDTIHVMPSNVTVVLERGRLKLSARLGVRGISMPVDIFFRSLAMEQQNRAIGILLSGSGTDGTLGLEEIKGQGGITFGQDKDTAKHFGMPGSAIGAGTVDHVLSPEQIAQEVARLSGHPYVAPRKKGERQARPVPAETREPDSLFSESSEEVRMLFTLLRTRRGVDFSLYKPGTLNRRIMRRMVLHKIETLERYVKFLQESAREADALFNDLLISVTGFFRDPLSFVALQRKVLPRLMKGRPADVPLRIWSCGCATGEEAYSLAIAVSEFLEKTKAHVPVQIFASDLNDQGIEKARAGIYHENILLDVSKERLRKYFVKTEGFYQVIKPIRDLCVFARQNVVMDPPFSNLDLISCRNVLIYLTPVLQKRVMPIFHYALKPNGMLLLGASETMAESSDLFDLFDKKNKIYAKKPTVYRPAVEMGRFAVRETMPASPRPKEEPTTNLPEKVDRLILTRYSPSGVLINTQMDVLQFRGQTAAFLEHQQGTASLNLLKMVREDLALDVRRAVNKAMQTGERWEQLATGVRLRPHGPPTEVLIEVTPITVGTTERFFLVLFREVTPAAQGAGESGKKSKRQNDAENRQVARLRDELASTRDSLQAIIEEQEATNEELKSANEEVQSSNEELQSTNEELETAREELQSTNEELTTLNQELQNRNSELAFVNNDLTNLLNSVNLAVIILGRDLTVRRFTAMAEKTFNFIPSDVGRRLSDITRNINVPDLEEIIGEVTENLTVVEREVQDREGRWYSLRIRPYRTQDNRIDGAVLMLLDIEELKRAMLQMVGIVRHPLLLLYEDLMVSRANDAFCRTFRVTPEETENHNLYELGNGQWNVPKLRELLEDLLPKQAEVHDFLVEHEFPRIGWRRVLVNARRFYGDGRGVQRIAIAFEDVTGQNT